MSVLRPASARAGRRIAATTAASALALTGLAATTALAPTASATPSFTWTRYGGPDRFSTAAAIATAAYPSGAPAVVLASGIKFPDALSGAYLAGSVTAPILLTTPATLPTATATAITTLAPAKVYILGSAGSVSDTVAAQVAAITLPGGAHPDIVRLAGDDRFATSAAIVTSLPADNIGVIDGKKTALLASGLNFPDALAASAAAARTKLPLLLTLPTALPTPTENALTSLGIQQVVVLGGTPSVGDAVTARLATLGITTQRLSGPDRFATAATIAEWSVTTAGIGTTSVAVARGDNAGGGVDALGLAALAGVRNEPILLSPGPIGNAPTPTLTWLDTHATTLTRGDIAGSVNSVTATQARQMLAAAGGPALDVNQFTNVTIRTNGQISRAPALPVAVSDNGRYSVIRSFADLASGALDDNGSWWIRDVVVNRTAPVLRGSSVTAVPWTVPAELRYQLVETDAALVGTDTNGRVDVYRIDLTTGAATLVSATTTGSAGNADSTLGYSGKSQISRDGRYASFSSTASNLVAADPNGAISDLFVRDLVAGTTTRVAACSTAGDLSDIPCDSVIAGNGSAVAFVDYVDLLNDNASPVRRWDRVAGTLAPVSVRSGGTPVTGYEMSIDTSGTKIVFSECEDAIDPADSNADCDIFLWTSGVAVPTRVSATPSGTSAQFLSEPAISGDGTTVAWSASVSTSAAPRPLTQVIVRTLSSPAAKVASLNAAGRLGSPDKDPEGEFGSGSALLNATGSYLLFATSSPDIAGWTGTTSNAPNSVLRRLS
ncbi:MAG: cell wall-binding repeat-containing protein [Kineosporiaceae bacterium]